MSIRTLDLGDPAPFAGTIGEPRHLAWPVYAYRVTIPTEEGSPDSLNAFERVVVELLDAAGPMSGKALADETCIPVDLVRSVVLRLRDRELLDPSNRLTVGQRARSSDTPRRETFRTAIVFQDRIGGRIFPFLKALDQEGALATRESWIDLRVTYDDQTGGFPPPQPKDVVHAAEEMRRRSAAWGTEHRFTTPGQVRVLRHREPYLIDCSIAVLQRDSEFRIADPFGVGYSRVLEDQFQELLAKDAAAHTWMMEWRTSLTTVGSAHGAGTTSREPFETVENERLFPKVVHHLRPGPGRQHRDLAGIYAAIEWALFYRAVAAGAETAVRLLRAQAAAEYSDWLAGLAAAIGLRPPRAGFRPLVEGKLRDFLSGKAELETVLAINLIQAELEPAHPLRELANAMPDLITRLRELTRARGELVHGNATSTSDDVELTSDPFMRICIQALLPSMRFDGTLATSHSGSDAWADLSFDARTNLLSRFSYGDFNRLGPSVQASIVSAERAWLAHGDGEDALPYLLSAYGAIQGAVAAWVNAEPGSRGLVGAPEAVAAANAIGAGLGELPSELSSINSRRAREALEGNHLSLGASVLALLAISPPATLTHIASTQPDFITTIAAVIRFRGHGNEPVPMSHDDLALVRSGVIQTIATILDHNQRN